MNSYQKLKARALKAENENREILCDIFEAIEKGDMTPLDKYEDVPYYARPLRKKQMEAMLERYGGGVSDMTFLKLAGARVNDKQ